jgi:hypothetical protein
MNLHRRIYMDVSRRRRALPVLVLIPGLLGWLACLGRAPEQLPAASEVTRRMIERSQALARDAQGPQYTYEKRSLLERLDTNGKCLSSEQKIHQVTLIAGLPFNRLVKIQGRELNAEELQREQARAERFRQRFISADAKELAARRQGLMTPELLDRYQFAVEKRMVLSNRSTLVLTFKPKEGDLPCARVQDRVLNCIAGRLWVDEEEAETARIEASLVKPISLGWFGFLGSLSRCEACLERQRLPDGVWTNTKQALLIHCRKLTAPMRFRTTEVCQGFQKAARKQ